MRYTPSELFHLRVCAGVDVSLAELRELLADVQAGDASPYEALAVAKVIERFARFVGDDALDRAAAARIRAEKLADL